MMRTTVSPSATSIRPALVSAGCEDDGGDDGGEDAAITTGANAGVSVPISGGFMRCSFVSRGCRTGADAGRSAGAAPS